MNRFLLILSLLLINVFAFAQNYEKHELILQLQPKTDAFLFLEDVNQNFPQLNAELKETLSKNFNIQLVGINSNLNENEALQFFFEFPNVLSGQLNYKNIKQRDSIPNDPSYIQQWCHYVMDSEFAWARNKGGLTSNGDTIVVAVIDGGNQPHEDLDFYVNRHEIPNNGLDDDNNGFVDDVSGWNAYNNNGNVPSDYHGNHVAGIIGAIGNNDEGVTGVNWNVKILSVAGSSSNQSTVVKAYDYVYTLRDIYNRTNGDSGAFVVSTNSSFGINQANPNNFPIWCNFYDSLGKAGILSATATANANFDIDVVGDMPTACTSDFMIAVTNTNSTDNKYAGAGFGKTTIDIGAPGSNIYSTGLNNTYSSSTGTSMATPQVAGAIALMYANICDLMWQEYENDPEGLANTIKDMLLTQGFDSIPGLQGLTVTGGRLNLNKAVAAVNEHCRVLSIKNQKQLHANTFTVYPNPSDGLVNITSTENSPIEIYTIDGKLFDLIYQNSDFHQKNFRQGIYVIKQLTANGLAVEKLIVH